MNEEFAKKSQNIHTKWTFILVYFYFSGSRYRFDAALTCPEPWSHVNHSIKLLEVNVCHLTQFAFFWTFTLKHGFILFEKNTSSKCFSIYSEQKHEMSRELLGANFRSLKRLRDGLHSSTLPRFKMSIWVTKEEFNTHTKGLHYMTVKRYLFKS